MAGDFLYLDSSALVKLVLPEPESESLREILPTWRYKVSSQVAFVEVHRAARRASKDDTVLRRAEQVLSGLVLIGVHFNLLGEAVLVEPRTLRSLDAIHLSTALSLGVYLGAVVTYDDALASAARQCNVKVLAPAPGLSRLPSPAGSR